MGVESWLGCDHVVYSVDFVTCSSCRGGVTSLSHSGSMSVSRSGSTSVGELGP